MCQGLTAGGLNGTKAANLSKTATIRRVEKKNNVLLLLTVSFCYHLNKYVGSVEHRYPSTQKKVKEKKMREHCTHPVTS